MKTFKVIKIAEMWSTNSLTTKVERSLEDLTQRGWEVVSVAFGTNLWYMPTAYITVERKEDLV